MFNLGTSEIAIILVVALLVLGPAKLPEIGKQIGNMLREFRNMSGDVQRALDLDGNHRSYDTEYNRSSSYDYQPDEPRAIAEQHTEDEPKAVEAFAYSAPAYGTPVAAIDTRHDEEAGHASLVEHDEYVQTTPAPETPGGARVYTTPETTNAVQVAKPSVV